MAQLTNTVLNGKLVVNGNIYGNLIGNASTATSAANAVSLNGKAESALSVSYATTASTATSATSATSATKISTNAAASTSTYVLLGITSSTAAQTPVRTGIEIVGTNINACTYTLNVGTIKGNYEVEGAVQQATYALSAGYAGYALKLNNGASDFAVGSSVRPVYFVNGVPVQTSTTLEVSITGNAATATQAVSLGTNAGSTTLPVYFSGGKPVATSTTLAISITGNASTATTANNATSLNNKAESALSVSHASTASSATSATSATSASYASRVVTSAKQTGSYHLTMVSESTSDTDGADIFVSNSKALTYNVSTGVLSATKFSGTFSGNASSATSATSAGYTAKVSATSSSDKNYIIGAASIGSSQSILANANIYVTNGDIVVNPTISTNEITHSDDNLVIGDRTNANYVNFVEDAMFDHSVSIEGALEVADEATFNATTYMNGNVYINNMLPVLNASTNSMGYGIRVLSSTEFAALQDISTSVIYFITP